MGGYFFIYFAIQSTFNKLLIKNQINMSQRKNLFTQPIHFPALVTRMLIGAGIAFGVAAFFVYSTDEPKPEWGNLWMIRPMIVLPFAGAVGGAFYYFMNGIREQGGGKMILANIVSALVFIIGLWMGIVLGFDGTLWN